MEECSEPTVQALNQDITLSVGIIGAGIAGLTSAIALTAAGHDVEIFEKSRFADEIGAGIHSTPNSSRVLQQYGFDFAAAKASESDRIIYLDPDTAEVVKTSHNPDCEKTYGAGWYTFHRADLHSELKKHALEGKTPGSRPAKLRLQSLVKDVDVDGTITLADGEIVHKDLVIVADGVRTAFVEKVTQSPVILRASGRAMLRFLVRLHQVAEEPQTRQMADGLSKFVLSMKGDMTFISYPCGGRQYANCGIYIPDTIDWQGAWSREVSHEDLMQAVRGFHEKFVAVSDMASDISVWRLATRQAPVETLFRGKLVLVGDALHPMLPQLGQGGAMAVEDAGCLGVVLKQLRSAEELTERLQLYQHIRKDRVCAAQLLSSWNAIGLDKVLTMAQPYLGQTTLADVDAIHEWCFTGDVLRDSELALKQHLGSRPAKAW